MDLNLETVQTSLSKIYDYVIPYLPMANAHASNFIVDGHWNIFLSQGLQDELLLMDYEELRVLPSEMMVTSPEEADPDSERDRTKAKYGSSSHCSDIRNHDGSDCCDFKPKNYDRHQTTTQFCKEASVHTVEGYDLVVSTTTFVTLLGASEPESPFIGNLMNLKKSHEVEVMSQVCARLVKDTSCKMVIDFGSGKGYLGNSLSLQHNIPVLGIDAMSSYTQSAERRMGLLDKQWSGLTLNATSSGDKLTKKEKKRLKAKRSENANTVYNSEEGNNSKEILNTANAVTSTSKSSTVNNKYIPVTMFVDQNTDFIKLAMENFSDLFQQSSSDENSSDSGSLERTVNDPLMLESCATKSNGKCEAAVSDDCITSDTTQCNLLSDTTQCNLLLTGLHTCGNLASTSLYLFVNSPSLQTVCSVGCCYNLIDEEFAEGCSQENKDATSGSCHGFPMSQFLREKKASLGSTARNLASQSVHRLSAKDEPLQGERFYPRALLEKIVQDTCEKGSVTWRGLRNLEKKCHSTEEYIQKALEKLNISHVISDDVIKSYVKQFADCKHKLAAFFQLRATLAPCIESLILLDRLCYLVEQATVKKAYLVKMFDPVISPRCYGIVAFKQ